MTALVALDRLRGRIADCQRRLEGSAESRAHHTQRLHDWLEERLGVETELRKMLDDLLAEVPSAEATAAEEDRLARVATARAELDDLLEDDRREQERQARMAELRGEIAVLDGEGDAS